MGQSFVWKASNGTLSVAADWTDLTTGGTAVSPPGSADAATIAGQAVGLILVSGALDVASLVTAAGIAVSGNVAAGTLADSGTLVATAGGTLSTGGAGVTGALVASGALVQVAGSLGLSGSADAADGGTLAAGAVSLAGGTLTVDAVSFASVGGGSAAAGTLEIGAGGAISGSGAIEAAAGIALAGTIAASGVLALFGAIGNGSGTLSIGAGATLFVAGAVGTGIAANFAGAGGTLELLTAGATFGATVAGFAAGDAIEIAGDAIAGAKWASGVLTLTDTAGIALPLALPDTQAQTYDGAVFVPVPDGFGGTDILLAPAPVAPPNGNVAAIVPAGTFQAYATSNIVSSVTVAGTLVAEQHTGTNALFVTGTVVAFGSLALLSAPSDTVSGLMIAVGAHATAAARTSMTLSGTLAATGGGLALAAAMTLAGGVLTLDPTSFMTLGTASAVAGQIALAAGSTLSGFGRIEASLDANGLVLVQGGTLLLSAPAFGSGSVQIGSGGTLEVLAPLALPVGFGAGATLQIDGAASLIAGPLSGFSAGNVLDIADMRIDGADWAGGTLSLSTDGSVVATLPLAGSYAGQSWQVQPDGFGGTDIALGSGGGGQPITVAGTLSVASTVAAPSIIANAGALVAMQGGTLVTDTLQLAAGATLAGTGVVDGAIADAGTIAVGVGALLVAGAISGAGMVTIAAGGTLFAEAGFAAATPVAMGGKAATLALFAGATAAPGAISGFAAKENFDIVGADVLSAAWASTGGGLGTLDLTGTAGDLGSLTLVGNFAGQTFQTAPDGSGGTLITPIPRTGGTGGGPVQPAVPCFAAGTRIATPRGAMPVEVLRPGDIVLTQAGPSVLRWVGCRRVALAGMPEARPVRIRAGALATLLGAALPLRDLLVSPQHALLLGGLLVPAVALAGARGIGREAVASIGYHHLGLEPHAAVLAEGVPAETFLPLSESARFDMEFGERPPPGPGCAPRVEGGATLAALRRRLLPRPPRIAAPGALRGHFERAIDLGGGMTRLEGWALDDAAEQRPVRLDVLHGRRRVAVAIANRWRPDLDRAGLAGGSCAFELELPGAGPFELRRRPDGAVLAGL